MPRFTSEYNNNSFEFMSYTNKKYEFIQCVIKKSIIYYYELPAKSFMNYRQQLQTFIFPPAETNVIIFPGLRIFF